MTYGTAHFGYVYLSIICRFALGIKSEVMVFMVLSHQIQKDLLVPCKK